MSAKLARIDRRADQPQPPVRTVLEDPEPAAEGVRRLEIADCINAPRGVDEPVAPAFELLGCGAADRQPRTLRNWARLISTERPSRVSPAERISTLAGGFSGSY